MPKLTIVKNDGLFLIVDEETEGSCYGKYDTRREAEEILADWEVYFESEC